ncbi:hypothetical protein HNR02_004715 [Amycolatopsis endophytica]|uniref:Uncharacterized protein n=1 Tax=Amycolatopsis endophytica TaxID=860233 RepID=A0A853B9E8_9PSEU|nr:hypothetical protein [Amycolatopsis endophytica]
MRGLTATVLEAAEVTRDTHRVLLGLAERS